MRTFTDVCRQSQIFSGGCRKERSRQRGDWTGYFQPNTLFYWESVSFVSLMQETEMLQTSQKKFAPAQIDDAVRIQIPDLDRGHTDNRNVLAVVVEIEDSDFY
ncbi:hypothetical protein TNCV_1993461 [Trichonephila clavipes]|nr:hypothetical protein TNCV_1993461 [Trichonephila clavipes]